MAKLWTVKSTGELKSATLAEYSEEEVQKILDSAKDYLICYDWLEEKTNWDDERGDGNTGGLGYFRISEQHVLVCNNKAVGVVFQMEEENYGRFSCSYYSGNYYILFGDSKKLNFNCSYYIGSTDVEEKNIISLVNTSSVAADRISNGRICLTGLVRIY